MSKAVLVMDMPKDCEDCPLFQDGDKRMRECKASREGTEWDYYKVRPNWCPLRELPGKAEVSDCGELCDTDDWYDSGYADGYNACIDELLKGVWNIEKVK